MISVEAIEDADEIVREILGSTVHALRTAGLEGQARGVESTLKLSPAAPCVGKTLGNVSMTVRMAHDMKDRDPWSPIAIAAEMVALASAAVACRSSKTFDLSWLGALAKRVEFLSKA